MKTSKKFSFVIIIVASLLMVNDSSSEPRNLLLEYCTGTWCGWCPCGHQAINTIESTYPQTIAIAYHGASSDPWQNFNGSQVRSLLGFSGYPTGIIDRTNTPSSPYVTYDMWMSRVTERYTNAPMSTVSLAVTSKSFNTSNNSLEISVNATALENLSGQYKISFVLIENNLVYPQNHYSQCGTTGYVNDYIHNHVVRSMLNGPTGENINTGGVWNQNQSVIKNLSTTLEAGWIPANCKVVVFAYKDSTTLAHGNVQQAIEETVTGVTGITGSNILAEGYTLSQNYPNPFNPTTSIQFSIPKDGLVSFKIFDSRGVEVMDYLNEFLQSGSYNVQIDGSGLSSGVYFYELRTADFKETKRMILVK